MILLLVLTLCPSALTPCPHESLLHNFFKAYNSHDVDGMLSHVTDDIQWYSVLDDKVAVEASGKPALQSGMTGYFKSLPSSRSELVSQICGGSYISTYEKAIWQNKKGETKSQSSMAVYQIRAGLIAKVWYFPSE